MYIIVGASGFLGTYFLKNILERTDENVLAVARHPLPVQADQKRVTWAACDVADPESTETFCEKYLSGKEYGGGGI